MFDFWIHLEFIWLYSGDVNVFQNCYGSYMYHIILSYPLILGRFLDVKLSHDLICSETRNPFSIPLSFSLRKSAHLCLRKPLVRLYTKVCWKEMEKNVLMCRETLQRRNRVEIKVGTRSMSYYLPFLFVLALYPPFPKWLVISLDICRTDLGDGEYSDILSRGHA